MVQLSAPETFVLPDLLAGWPFECEWNPCQDIVAESTAWAESYNPFSLKAQKAFNRCQFGIFSSLAYPYARGSHFRIICDLMNFVFVFDEHSDDKPAAVVRHQADDILNALRYPDIVPDEPSLLWRMTQDICLRVLECASESSAQRFIKDFAEYTESVYQQAVDRDEGRKRSMAEYFDIRRGTIGVWPFFDLFLLCDDLPDEAVAHPTIQRLASAAIDMTILANDVYSYNVEQSRGDDDHNVVSVAMREKGLTIQEAMDYIGQRYQRLAYQFCVDFMHMPVYPEPVDQLVKEFCWAMGNWVTTNIKWSFGGERYFGKAGKDVAIHRTVTLLPKRN